MSLSLFKLRHQPSVRCGAYSPSTQKHPLLANLSQLVEKRKELDIARKDDLKEIATKLDIIAKDEARYILKTTLEYFPFIRTTVKPDDDYSGSDFKWDNKKKVDI